MPEPRTIDALQVVPTKGGGLAIVATARGEPVVHLELADAAAAEQLARVLLETARALPASRLVVPAAELPRPRKRR